MKSNPRKVSLKKSKPTQKNKGGNKVVLTWGKVALMAIVLVSASAIIVSLLSLAVLDPEKRAKIALEQIAKEYYTEYLYPRLIGTKTSPEEALKVYTETGVPKVFLRQMLWYDGAKNQNKAGVFANDYLNCDTNHTGVRFYPEAPYEKEDFRTEYYWSCDRDLSL